MQLLAAPPPHPKGNDMKKTTYTYTDADAAWDRPLVVEDTADLDPAPGLDDDAAVDEDAPQPSGCGGDHGPCGNCEKPLECSEWSRGVCDECSQARDETGTE